MSKPNDIPEELLRQLHADIAVAVSRAAHEFSGLDPHAELATEAQMRDYQLAEVRLWRALPEEVRSNAAWAAKQAAIYGANGVQVAAAGGVRPQHVNRTWPELGQAVRARAWLKRRSGEAVAVLAAFLALAERLHLDGYPGIAPTREAIATGQMEHDLFQLWYALKMDVPAWLRVARPDEDDAEARAAVRRLTDLTDDLRTTSEQPAPRRRGAGEEGSAT